MALPRIAPTGENIPEFLAYVADDVTRECVRQVAAQFGWPAKRVREGGTGAALSWLSAAPAPPVLLVDVSDTDDVMAAMDALAEVCEPHTRVVAIGIANDIGLYRALIQMGVSDYLVKPVAAGALSDALRRAERADRPEPTSARPCKTLALIGARGGVGVTGLAVSAAWALAHEQHLNTVLLDLDLQFGAAALTLDLEPGRGLRELLTHPERIDGMLIGSALSQESERLRVLGAEEPLDSDFTIGADGLPPLLSALGDGSDAVVLDIPRKLDALGRAGLMAADTVALVTDLSLPAMRDTQRLLRLLTDLRGDRETVVVGNRIGGVAGEVPREEFERGVGRKLDFAVPVDAKAASAAAEQGKALLAVARPGPTAAELRRFAQVFGGSGPAAPQKDTWLKRMLGK